MLCGGRSSRMGRPKAWLQFGEETALQRVVRTLEVITPEIVVVAAEGQALPPLPQHVQIVRDSREGLGPLAGIALGLESLHGRCESAYVSGCDVPLLKPEFVRAVVGQLNHHEIAVVREERFYHPLAAIYRTFLFSRAWDFVNNNQLRPLFLIESARTRDISLETVREVDAQLDSLQNMNTPADYDRLLARAHTRP